MCSLQKAAIRSKWIQVSVGLIAISWMSFLTSHFAFSHTNKRSAMIYYSCSGISFHFQSGIKKVEVKSSIFAICFATSTERLIRIGFMGVERKEQALEMAIKFKGHFQRTKKNQPLKFKGGETNALRTAMERIRRRNRWSRAKNFKNKISERTYQMPSDRAPFEVHVVVVVGRWNRARDRPFLRFFLH